MAWKDWGTQKRDFFLTKTATVESRKRRIFSPLGDKETQPKNRGEDIYKYIEYPVIHELNKNDKGIDANGVTLVKNKWYAYDTNGAMTGDAAGYDTVAEAKTAAGANGSIKSGNGNLYGGSSDFATIDGSFPALRETGGLVNRVGMTRVEVTAKVSEFGIYTDFTQKELDMTDDARLLTKKSKALGEAMAEVQERQVEIALLSASEQNRFIAGDAANIGEMGAGTNDYVKLQDIRNMQEHLKRVRVPLQTKIIDGSKNVDTVVVGKGYFAYFPQGLLPTLEDTVDSSNTKVFRPVESYANGAGYIHELEAGKISNTRLLEVPDMAIYEGAGATVDADADGQTDAEAAANEAGTFHTTMVGGDEKFDVYPILYVGTDSFATIGFSGDNAQVKHAMPQIIPGVDAYGKNGIVSCNWYFGCLIYREERINQLLTLAKV